MASFLQTRQTSARSIRWHGVCQQRQRWQSRTGVHPGSLTQVMTWRPAHTHLLFSAASGKQLLHAEWGWGALLPPNSPHPTTPHLIQCHPFWNRAVWRVGRRDVPSKGGCRGGLRDSICPLPPQGAPLGGRTQGQLQKHPHLPAAMVLLGRPLAQLACLLADGRQGLVAGTIVPTTFLGTQDEGASQPPSPKAFGEPDF